MRSIVQVGMGQTHRCVRDHEGRVFCWGRSDDLALGQGSTTMVEAPVEVPLPGIAGDLDVSTQTACASLEDGRVFCWGANRYRQLGAGEADGGPIGTPIQVELPVPVFGVSVSPTHACSQQVTDRTLWCWGAHRHSQLGDGAHTTSFTMEPVRPRLGVVQRFGVALEWSCADDLFMGVHCWGEPASAPHRALFVAEPTPIGGLNRPEVIRLGDDGHACLLGAGRVECFAFSESDPRPASAFARPVPGLEAGDVVDIDVGYWQACALHADGGVSCWPPNGHAERVLGLE